MTINFTMALHQWYQSKLRMTSISGAQMSDFFCDEFLIFNLLTGLTGDFNFFRRTLSIPTDTSISVTSAWSSSVNICGEIQLRRRKLKNRPFFSTFHARNDPN